MLFDMEKEREGLERGFIPQNLLRQKEKGLGVWGGTGASDLSM